jgi:hypothetical protein
VKSVRTLIGLEEREEKGLISGGPGIRPGSFRMSITYDVRRIPEYDFVLPDNQRDISEVVKEVADRLALEVKIVDVSRENVVRREIQKISERIRTFPALVVDSVVRIEGEISKEQVESLLSELK